MPILLGWFIATRRHVSWRLFGVGAVGFVLSQIFHIPFNWLVLDRFTLISAENLILLAIFLGLSAGTFEEVTRYLIYRFWITDARSWGTGLMYGAGWGGIEAIILGAIGLLNFIILIGMKNGFLLELVPVEQMDLLNEQIEALFNVPWTMALLGAVERVFALCFHLAASILVLQVFLRKNILWLFAAILWHTILNATVVYAVATWGAIEAEAILAVLSIFSLIIIFGLKAPEPKEPEPDPLPAAGPAKPLEHDLQGPDLDKRQIFIVELLIKMQPERKRLRPETEKCSASKGQKV